MKRSVLLIVLASFALTGRASAQERQVSADQQQLIGTWKLLSYVGEEVPSGVRSDVMGPHPSGYLNYGRDGRMMLIIVGSDRKKPAGTVATPEEAEALIRSILAYAGKYTVDSEARTVTHHIDVSWDQSRTGESHVRSFKLDAGHLTLVTQPSRDPATGKQTVRTLIWERLK